MKDTLIAQARLSSATAISSADGLPSEIQYMPPGRQTVTPFVEGEPHTMELEVGPLYATIFQAALTRALASAADGKGDKPFIDFNHDDGAAAGHPTEFYWGGDDPIKGGVRMKLAWSASGKGAVTGGDFTRFSPQWVFSKRTNEPLGLPINMGGLVNRAAFKTIASLTAAATAGPGAWVAAAADASEECETPEDEQAEAASARAFQLSATAQVADDGPPATSAQQHIDAARAHEQAAAMMKAVGRQHQFEMHKHCAEEHNRQAIHFSQQSQDMAESNKPTNKPTNMTTNVIDFGIAAAGDYPGHPFHGNQWADGGSVGAEHEASHVAAVLSHKASDKGGHLKASAMHERAAAIHAKKGNSTTAAYHQTMALMHSDAAKTAKAKSATTETTMTPEELKNAIASALSPLQAQILALETKATDAVKASAKSAVQRHVGRGAIPAADTKSQTFWEEAYIANATNAEEQLARLPGMKFRQVITATNTGDVNAAALNTPHEAFIAKAKAYGATNKLTDNEALIAFAGTAEGAQLYAETRAGLPVVKK